jgi:hypothetical protein
VSAHETVGDPCPHGTEHEAAPRLDDYETDHGTVVVYDTARPLAWIEIDPDALVEVRRP